jgi:hypothetical protein
MPPTRARPAAPLLAGAVALAMTLTSPAALACSICRCGDPTFNALGPESHTTEGLNVAADWDRVSKTQGADHERESMVEHRYSASLYYSFSDRWLVAARLPYSHRSLKVAEHAEEGAEEVEGEPGHGNARAEGLADPEFSVQYRVWSAPFTGDVGSRASIALSAGVKTSWGENGERAHDGERLDEHVQPGTGSTDVFFGASGFFLLDRASTLFASAQWRDTGRNDHGYQYGRALLANLAYERKLLPRLDSVLELNYRHARHDETDPAGTKDENTGGGMLYLSPRMLFEVGGGFVLRLGAQIPVSKSLHGAQNEKTVYNLGLTWGLGR